MRFGDDTLLGIIFFFLFIAINLTPIIFGIKQILDYKKAKEKKKLVFGILLLIFAVIIILGAGILLAYRLQGGVVC